MCKAPRILKQSSSSDLSCIIAYYEQTTRRIRRQTVRLFARIIILNKCSAWGYFPCCEYSIYHFIYKVRIKGTEQKCKYSCASWLACLELASYISSVTCIGNENVAMKTRCALEETLHFYKIGSFWNSPRDKHFQSLLA